MPEENKQTPPSSGQSLAVPRLVAAASAGAVAGAEAGGLRGVWAQVGQVTVLGLFMVIFYQQHLWNHNESIAERQLCREAVRRLELAGEHQAAAIRQLAESRCKCDCGKE